MNKLSLARRLTSFLAIYRGLPRSIYVLFFARIVNSLGSLVFPFMTMFLTQRLGLSEGDAGWYIMLSGTAFIPGSLLGGKLADHFGRKRIMVTAQFLAAASFIPCAFLGASMTIPLLLIAGQFFLGVVHPTTQAMTTDLTTPENRKAAFSLLYLGHNIGFAVGPLVAGYLYQHHTPWIFLGDALTTFLSLILVCLFVGETLPDHHALKDSLNKESHERAEEGSALSLILRRPGLVIFILLAAVMNFVYAQMSFSLPLFMAEVFSDRGPVLFGSVMSFNAIIVILGTPLLIAATRRLAPVLSTALAAALYAVGFGMLYFLNAYPLFILSTFIWTSGEIFSATNVDVHIANHTPISHRGRFNAIFPIIMGIGFAMSPP